VHVDVSNKRNAAATLAPAGRKSAPRTDADAYKELSQMVFNGKRAKEQVGQVCRRRH